jgi:hypothetical protein
VPGREIIERAAQPVEQRNGVGTCPLAGHFVEAEQPREEAVRYLPTHSFYY